MESNKIKDLTAKLENALKEWRMTFDAMKDAIMLLDRTHTIVKCNKATKDMLNLPYEDIIGKKCWEVIHETLGPVGNCPVVRLCESKKAEREITQMNARWYDIYAEPVFDNNRLVGAVHIISDITDRKHGEEELRRSNKALKMITECNKALVRSSCENELVQEVCDVLITIGQFAYAWICVKDENDNTTYGIVSAKKNETVPRAFHLRNYNPLEDPATTAAMKSGKTSLVLDIVGIPYHDDKLGGLRDYRFLSMVAIPLIHQGTHLGALNIYTDNPEHFYRDEVKLIEKLAQDLSYGIITFRTRKEQEQTQKALVKTEKQLAIVQREAGLGSLTWDQHTLSWSEATCRIFGVSPTTSPSIRLMKRMIHISDKASATKALDAMLKGKGPDVLIYRIVKPDGEERRIQLKIEIIHNDAGKLTELIGSVRDITAHQEKRDDHE